MTFKDYISKREYKRSIKLLRMTREKLGIDAYLLMKKILAVAAICKYYQFSKGINCGWIDYIYVLKRNENIIYGKYHNTPTIETIKSSNAVICGVFFGVVFHTSFAKTLVNAYNYWAEEENKKNYSR